MSNVYIGLSLSLFCVFLAYIIVSKLILVAVFCVVLACVYFKDDLTFLRYLSAHVSIIYLWCFEFWSNIQNMYHQSNSSNFPVRKCIENNGTLTNKHDRQNHKVKSNITYNLNSPYRPRPNCDTQSSLTTVNWSSGSNRPMDTTSMHSYFPFQPNSTSLEMSHNSRSTEYSIDFGSGINSTSKVHMPGNPRPITQSRMEDTRTKYIEPVNFSNHSPASDRLHPRNDDQPYMDAQLFANVNSPGFCSRIAERLSENMTHQQKYDSFGAFPVVHLKSQSPKIKVKTPVRVRLAPSASKDLMFTNIGTNSIPRPSLIGADESMKSVLQVLKEISRKRIHSHVEDDSDENSKRLRVSESQFICDSGMHASLLQQNFQGKRAREDSSPNEADAKKRRRSIQNNEISSSLSSSKSVKAPHLQPQKRKAQAIEDSYNNSTPVLGKLLKVQTEVTPPPLPISPSPPVSTVSNELKASPLAAASTSVSESVEDVSVSDPEPVTIKRANSEALETNDEEKVVSRLLGRMSNQAELTVPQEIRQKKNVFMCTNDLSLSPPKENRLAAMIAVLGGPNNNHDIDLSDHLKQPGKEDLFMTPKLNKKVTFNDSLTTTKVYDKDKSAIGGHHDCKNSSDTSNSMPLSQKTLSETIATYPSNVQFSIKTHNTAPATPSFSSNSSPINAGNCEAVKQNEDTASVKSAQLFSTEPSSASSINITNSVSTQQSSQPFTPTSSSDTSSASLGVASNISLTGIGNAKPFEFICGTTNSPATNNKESIGFYSTKGLSFDNNLKTPELTSSAKSTSANIKKDEKEVLKTTSPETARSNGESENSFSLFPNKDNTKTESSKIYSENKPLVNGLAPTGNISSSPFAFNMSATHASSNKPVSSNFGSNLSSSTLNSSSPFITTSKSSNLTVTSPESSLLKESLSTNQPFTMFSNVTGSTSQPHQSLFENKFKSPSNSSVFEDGSLKVGVYKTESTTQASLLSLGDSKFGGSTTAISNPTTVTTTNQSTGLFGNLSNNTTPKQNIFGAVGNPTTQPSNQIFGSSMASTTTPQASGTSFGILSNNTVTSQSNNGFGSQFGPAQSQGLFGSVLPTTNPQISTFSTASQASGQPSLSREVVNGSQVSKPLFQSIANPTPAFGILSNAPSTTGFEIQSRPASFGFGNQANIASSPFGNSSTLNFGGQTNNSLNTTHNSFSHPVETTSSKSSSSMNLANSPASSLSSPFVFGSPSTTTQETKPVAATKPFSFGSQQSSLAVANSSHLSVPPFNSTSVGFGVNPQPPAFSSVIPQPAAPVFAFGQGPTSAQNFQLNTAGSQPVGGGMFNIGSGSTAPRSKTTAARRRNK